MALRSPLPEPKKAVAKKPVAKKAPAKTATKTAAPRKGCKK